MDHGHRSRLLIPPSACDTWKVLLIAMFGTCAEEPGIVASSSDPVELTNASVSDDQDQDGWPIGEDCDDQDASVYPLAEEVCGDGIDQDCDGGDQCADELHILDADRVIHGAWPGGMAGYDVALADLDGDGLHEVIVAVPYAQRAVLIGGTEQGSMEPYRSLAVEAWAVEAGSDMDQDGWPEVAIAAPYEEDGRGVVYLLERWPDHLEARDADGILVGAPGDHAGWGLVLRPDSVWVTALAACEQGAVYRADEVLRDERLLEDATLRVCGPVSGDIAVGDVDGDGVDDLLAGLRLDDRSAALSLSPEHGESTLDFPFWTGAGSAPSVAVVPDVDGDGMDDLIIGPWLLTSLEGGSVDTRAHALFTDRWGEPLRDPIEGAGDLNDDGYGDLLLGDASGEGAVWVVQGPVSGSWAATRSVLVIGGERSGEVHGATDGTIWLGAPWANERAGMVAVVSL